VFGSAFLVCYQIPRKQIPPLVSAVTGHPHPNISTILNLNNFDFSYNFEASLDTNMVLKLVVFVGLVPVGSFLCIDSALFSNFRKLFYMYNLVCLVESRTKQGVIAVWV
jgi:hypothetical protein